MSPKSGPMIHFADRLYFTTFAHPAPSAEQLNNAASNTEQDGITEAARKKLKSDGDGNGLNFWYFTIDEALRYVSFSQDWGPLNLAMVYKACILIHELLEDPSLKDRRIVLYSSDDPRKKANAALLMALYVLIVLRLPPWEAFRPIAEVEFMPFRDAGRGRSDFNLNIQDCLWGMWKAMQYGLCDMNEFDVEDYEYYEKVENGDWNWLTPNFIAFASPLDLAWIKKEKERKEQQELDASGSGPSTPSPPTRVRSSSSGADLALQRKLPTPFLNVLDYFEKRNVKLVVRLNNELYDKQVFEDRGIAHEELYFDDGTNPTDEIVRKFLDLSDAVLHDGGVVAVHCKAGLGRTGTLIGAYLIWKYGFTANEAIAFMRIVRPGCVVGPQQQYMYLKQLEWAKWAAVDEVRKAQMAAARPSVPTLITPATPPAEVDEMDADANAADIPPVLVVPQAPPPLPPVTPSKHVVTATAKARLIATPGQPRKTPKSKRSIVETDIEDCASDSEELDTLPVLKRIPSKTRSSRSRGATASEQRPARTTRAAAAATGLSSPRKPMPTSPGVASSTRSKTGTQPPPNKIPRLANGAITRSTAAAANNARHAPSRLPTLVAAKRTHTNSVSSLGEMTAATAVATFKAATDAWVANGAPSVVVPGSKSLRPVRRRRSSFSSADVVA